MAASPRLSMAGPTVAQWASLESAQKWQESFKSLTFSIHRPRALILRSLELHTLSGATQQMSKDPKEDSWLWNQHDTELTAQSRGLRV